MGLRTYISLFLFFISFQFSYSQMVVGQDTLVGNEWIKYDESYYKFVLKQDGVYRISTQTLEAAGISPDDIAGGNIRLFNMGQQVPLFVSTNGTFSSNDFVEFYGYKNRGELDQYLYRRPAQDMLNPDHSLYSDKNAYYLTTQGTEIPVRVNSIANDLSNPPAQEAFYLHKESINFHDQLNDPYFPVAGGGSVSYSSYMHTEGFSKLNENISTTQIPALNRFPGGPDALLHVRIASSNYGTHTLRVTLNNQELGIINLTDLQISDYTYTVPASLLTDDNQLIITAESVMSRHTLATIDLTYARSPTLPALSSASIILSGSSGDQHLILSGFPHQGVQPIVYSYDGKNRMVASIDVLNNVEFKWPEIQENLRLEIIDPVSGIQFIPTLTQKVFTDYSGDDTEYIVITHPDLMEIGTGSEFVQYRASVAGGSYRAKSYSILDLYDQFGYGIEKHPQAVRNFVDFFDRTWPSAKMIFVVGRAIEYNRSRYENGSWEEGFFVPTFGRPGSDNLLAGTVWDLVPRFPIARLAIVEAQGVTNYLAKVKEHDEARFAEQTIAAKEWIKNVMHLGGGKSAIEQNDFKAVLNSLGNDLATSDYGAKVHFFQKESTDIIGESQSAQILKLLNEGCGIINYLGHSAASTFEFNINDPSEWNNAGRYPFFSAMGCSAGQIHGTLFSLSDNYVQIPNEGAIAFISGSGSQFASALTNWARPWYDYIGNVGYGNTAGASVLYGLRAVGNFVNPELTGSNQYRYLLEQQTFQGDPALKFHPMPGPDYLVDRSSVSISPDVLSVKLDSFDITFSIANIGRNLRQDVGYTTHIKRPDGQVTQVAEAQIFADTYESIVTVRLPLQTEGKAGAFRLLITLDPDNLIPELPAPDAESNNQLRDNLNVEGIEFFVVDNVVSAVYPPDFGIVTSTLPELVATSSNSFVKRQDIVLEMDTTALFNSPSLLRERFIDHSATLKWSPQFDYVADRVYYWRVSADSISPEQAYLWSRRSFIYKPGTQSGWNQSHFYQLTDNTLSQLLPDSSKQSFVFDRKGKNFRMVNRYHDVALGLVPLFYEDGKFNAKLSSAFRNRDVHGFVVAIDSVTGDYLMNPAGGLYGSSGLTIPMEGFAYNLTEPESRQNMLNLIENIIPSGYYVFFYTYLHDGFADFQPEEWAEDETNFGKSIFSVIESQVPTSTIRSLATTGSRPYIVLFQKDRGPVQEELAANVGDVISISFEGGASLSAGTHISDLIGPSSRWFSIQSQIESMLDTAGENVLAAWALNKNLTDTLWISHNLTDGDTSISAVDANQYPYMQLALTTSDSVQFDPSDIFYWRVLFNGYPEIIINPDVGFVYQSDSLTQGETMKLSTYIENVSDYMVDSLPISLRIISEDNTTEQLNDVVTQLAPHSSALVEFQKSTSDLAGHYRVLMDVNPGQTVNETNYTNNIGILPLYIEGDGLNPILDVTFDGHHILDGDLVASKPVIVIQLHDENEFLRLEDTSSFAIFLEYPSDFEPQQISLAEDWVQFNQASASGQNIASIELRPELLEDGVYTLQVKAKDASGNFAGDNDYLISFEVINAESVSHLYNYPNPFSTATRFVYTLTGSGSPTYYKIQVMSISGRIVREITQDELGPLAVGTHMTDYVWDGTDETGGRLAAGTYIYRMIVKNEDLEDFDRYETKDDDTFFKKGWGKLVILR